MKPAATTKIKFLKLKKRLGLLQYQAIGLLEALWHATYANAPDGDVGRLSDDDIALLIGWETDASEMILALVETGWLDTDPEYRLIVHDWSEHVANHLKGAYAKHDKLFADQVAKQRPRQPAKHGATPTHEGATFPSLPSPSLPIPVRTVPRRQTTTSGDVLSAFGRWKGDELTLSDDSSVTRYLNTMPTDGIPIGDEVVSAETLLLRAIQNAIESAAVFRTTPSAIKYLAQIVERCIKDRKWPGEFERKQPPGGGGRDVPGIEETRIEIAKRMKQMGTRK